MALDETFTIEKSPIPDSLNIKLRLENIVKRQLSSSSVLCQLQKMLDQLDYEPATITPPNVSVILLDHNYALSSTSSGVSSASSSLSPTSPASTSSARRNNSRRFKKCSAKRKIIYEEEEHHEFSAEDENLSLQQDEKEQEYPKQIGDSTILGPNGTQVDTRSYSSIIWSSAASATRQLLGFVFSNDILATHTLTGKPSPAFYGRERPAKMQLDPLKAADIIYCVRSKFKCTEREIRAAITTKCSDTSKKYKRRRQKKLKSHNKI